MSLATSRCASSRGPDDVDGPGAWGPDARTRPGGGGGGRLRGQTGEEAYKAYNVFHPYTYEGAVDIDSITDEVMREATIAQISAYGQTPTKLFKKPVFAAPKG